MDYVLGSCGSADCEGDCLCSVLSEPSAGKTQMAGGDAGSSQLILAVMTELFLRLGWWAPSAGVSLWLYWAWACSVLAGSSGKRGSYMALSDIDLDVLSSFLPHYIGYKQITEANSDSEEEN